MSKLNVLGIVFCCILTGCTGVKPTLTPIAKNDARTRVEKDRERLRNPDGRRVGSISAESLGRNDHKPTGLEKGLGGAKIGFPIPINKDG